MTRAQRIRRRFVRRYLRRNASKINPPKPRQRDGDDWYPWEKRAGYFGGMSETTARTIADEQLRELRLLRRYWSRALREARMLEGWARARDYTKAERRRHSARARRYRRMSKQRRER